MLLYGCYGVWDSNNIYIQGAASVYETYRPSSKDNLSFEELKKINPEVFGWIIVNNTHIDYPLVQATDNVKYVNTDAKGKFSLSGAIFLDCRNKKDFSGLNNILYGHHMANNVMFGEIELFKEKKYFKSHKFGKLYYEDKWNKIEFFAFLTADAYDPVLYNTDFSISNGKDEYIHYVKSHALNYRNIPMSEKDKFVTLSTCTSTSTNGRYLLIGRIIK